MTSETPRRVLTWLGHSSVVLDLDGVRVLTDPLLLSHNRPLRRRGPRPAPERWRDPDVVLLSHLHHDHAELRSLRLVRSAPVITGPENVAWLRRKGLTMVDAREDWVTVPTSGGRPGRSGDDGLGGDRDGDGGAGGGRAGGGWDGGARDTSDRAGDGQENGGGDGTDRDRDGGVVGGRGEVRVRLVRADHGHRPMPHRPNGANGHLVSGAGVRVWAAGDTSLYDEMADLPRLAGGPIDLALVPIGGWGPRLSGGHLDPAQAARACALTGARAAVPVHWGTLHAPVVGRFPRGWMDEGGERFAQALKEHAPECVPLLLAPGESIPFPS